MKPGLSRAFMYQSIAFPIPRLVTNCMPLSISTSDTIGIANEAVNHPHFNQIWQYQFFIWSEFLFDAKNWKWHECRSQFSIRDGIPDSISIRIAYHITSWVWHRINNFVTINCDITLMDGAAQTHLEHYVSQQIVNFKTHQFSLCCAARAPRSTRPFICRS